MRRLSCSILALAAVLASTLRETAAQDVTAAAMPESQHDSTANLAFSKDGRLLREIQLVNRGAVGELWHVRAVTYDAVTGTISQILNLGPDTSFLSATSDGRSAVISVSRGREDAQVQLLLVDMDTGKTQSIPSKWFDADDHNPHAQISAHGRLVSAFTESGPENGPLIVTLYNWRTKRLIAKQATGYPAGGFSWGGVTGDGKIEFLNNRVGGVIVDPKTGRLIVSVGAYSYRSLDGAWIVEFPNLLYGDAPREITIKNGLGGQAAGKLDLEITDEKENWVWRAAFCGTSGRFIAATYDTVQAFEIPSGRKITDFPEDTWKDAKAINTDHTVNVSCSSNGKRVAIRSGTRLTLHHLK